MTIRNILRKSRLFLTFLFLIILASGTSLASKHEAHDPFESANRKIYQFNRVLDNVLAKPIAKMYRFVVPEEGRTIISNGLNNLAEPVNFLNAGLQGNSEQAFTSFWRFFVNSTFGIGGLFDIASLANLEYREEDFGQTLGSYGFNSGPYIMLPIFGPSNIRDALGRAADSLSNPFNYSFTDYGIAAHNSIRVLSLRENNLDSLNEIDRTSLDPYATIRSIYTQHRINQVNDGNK